MGNLFSLGNDDGLALDFNSIRTENISSTIPYMNKLSSNAQLLANRLNTKNRFNSNLATESDNIDMYKLFEKTQNLNKKDSQEFSDTSPFISSDVYNTLIKQKGGADKSEDSEEAEESSSSSVVSSSSEKKDAKKDKDIKKTKKDSSSSSSESEDKDVIPESTDNNTTISSLSIGGSSNRSSSAHSNQIDSSKHSKHSKKSKSKHSKILSDSINTSDINMISVEE
jgi:hypothetical protein